MWRRGLAGELHSTNGIVVPSYSPKCVRHDTLAHQKPEKRYTVS